MGKTASDIVSLTFIQKPTHKPDSRGRWCRSLRSKPRFPVTRVSGLIGRRWPWSTSSVSALARPRKVSRRLPNLWLPSRLAHGLFG